MTDNLKENNSWQSWSREIKFRAWINYIDWLPEMVDRNVVRSNFWWYQDDDSITLMQYTWLKDKNWVEIYEGDILQYYMWGKKMWWKVHYKDWSFWITFYRTPTTRRTQIISAFLSDKRRSVIIWNIYQNTKLLSDK